MTPHSTLFVRGLLLSPRFLGTVSRSRRLEPIVRMARSLGLQKRWRVCTRRVVGAGLWNTPDSHLAVLVHVLGHTHPVLVTLNTIRVFDLESDLRAPDTETSAANEYDCALSSVVRVVERTAKILDSAFGLDIVRSVPEYWPLFDCCHNLTGRLCEEGHLQCPDETAVVLH